MKKEKVVLAYSGGLDTSVAIKWLMQKIFTRCNNFNSRYRPGNKP